MTTPYYSDEHVTLYHGDCREVLPHINDRPDLVLTDPPYLVTKVGRHGSGEVIEGMEDAFWVLPAFREVYRVMAPDSFCVSFYSWRQADDFVQAWRGAGFSIMGHLVWVKRQMGLGTLTRSKHESAYLLTKGTPRPARVVPDVFDWQRERIKDHPSQKPVAAMAQVVSAIGPAVVLDPFMGVGSSLVAARQHGARVVGIELDEAYCEKAAERLRNLDDHLDGFPALEATP